MNFCRVNGFDLDTVTTLDSANYRRLIGLAARRLGVMVILAISPARLPAKYGQRKNLRNA